jgi:predicted amidohydrolase YtcJ
VKLHLITALPALALCTAVLALCTAACGPAPESRTAADLVLFDADVRTSDPRQPRAAALAVRDGRFVAVGDSNAIRQLIDGRTVVHDAGGRTVLPGLIDGHVHLGAGLSLMRGVDLDGIADRQEWLDRIAARAAGLSPGSWIVGGGWDHTLTPDGALPTRHDLDAIVPQHPVALADIDRHSTWVNSLALQLAGIDAATTDPPGGRIERHPATGEPTGILMETAADLVTSRIPPLSDEERLAALRDTLRHANRLGLTGAHNMSGRMEDYAALVERGELSLRIWFGMPADSLARLAGLAERRAAIASRIEAAAPAREHGPMLQPGFVKLTMDGVLSTRTAFLNEPYADAPGETGLPIHSQEALDALVAAANRQGFAVAIHAIGDRAVTMSLNAFASSPAAPATPNRVEHIEVVAPDDLERFARLDAVASMNPHHCITGIDKYNTARVGAERARLMFAWNRLLRAGASLVFGSDWATAPLDPLRQLDAATVREKPGGGPVGGWHPDNRVSFDDALFAYTQAAADAAAWGGAIGSITPGKWADFVILDGALQNRTGRDLLERRVQATYLAGGPVYDAGAD